LEKLSKIRLRAKEERRFKAGHPWVFSNELQESPKNLKAGEIVELNDAGGSFLAYGFANPSSLIAFRELSRDPGNEGFSPSRVDPGYFKSRFERAATYRRSWFSSDQSHRLIYGEADGLSGLIVDRFVGHSPSLGRVDVIQPHSAGMDLQLESILTALREWSAKEDGLMSARPARHLAILRRDASSREKEGLEKLPVKVIDLASGEEISPPEALQNFRFRVSGIMGSSLSLSANLISGQKTGFFFDQLQNIRLLETLLLRKIRNERMLASRVQGSASRPFRVLDLCSYVGQWSVHLLQTLMEREALPAEFTCADASGPALAFARSNLETAAAEFGVRDRIKIETAQVDVLEALPGIPDHGYEIVIADPPAFIKNRKSIPQGKQAYVQLFEAAIRKAAPGALVVCCSCSQLLSAEDFSEVIGKASRRSRRRVRLLAKGSPSLDHFSLPQFQEGHYLKSAILQIDEME